MIKKDVLKDKYLYDYQQKGVLKLVERRTVLLADDMGLGKTIQALVAAETLFQMKEVSRILIICPNPVMTNWKKEAEKWTNRNSLYYKGENRYGLLEFSKAPIFITSISTIVNDWQTASKRGTEFFETNFDLIIVDEAQKLKNPSSISSKTLSKAISTRRWALTGTPLENRPEELGAILRFLEPNEFPDGDFSDYESILKLADHLMLRRSKKDVLKELPEKIVRDVIIDMSADQEYDYNNFIEYIVRNIENLDHVKKMNFILQSIHALRKLAVLSDNNTSGKLDFLIHELETVPQNDKIVIFTTFANLVLPHFAKELDSYGVVRYTGSMTTEERDEANHRFENDPNIRIMLASIKAAGVGLNWTIANHVYHLDLWWNPQVLAQADDRVHRI